MACRIEHRSTSEWSAQRVHTARTDSDSLRARVRELGGGDSDLVGYESTEAGTRFQLHQEVRASVLPQAARSLVGGDLKVNRTESWRREDEGHYAGEVAAEIEGAPCSIAGSMWLRDLPGDGSELLVDGEVQVTIPLLGGKLERLVVDQVLELLEAEDRFTSDWLARH